MKYYEDSHIKILLNPSRNELKKLIMDTPFHIVRGLICDETGDLFCWDAGVYTHSDFKKNYGYTGIALEIEINSLKVVLAGGALELYDHPEKIMIFMANHGFPKARLNDISAMSAISDRYMLDVNNNENIQRCGMASFVSVDLDPRIQNNFILLEKIQNYIDTQYAEVSCP